MIHRITCCMISTMEGTSECRSVFIKGYNIQGTSVEAVKRREKPLLCDDIEKGEEEAGEKAGEKGKKLVEDVKTLVFSEKNWERIPKRVENLVWIKNNTFYKEALDDSKEERKKYDAKLEASKKALGEVTNEVYNVVGFFSVFQGVILTAVSQLTQTSSLHPKPLCGKVWFPVVLSVLAAIAAVVGIALKHREVHIHEKEIHANRQLQTEAIIREEELKNKGKNYFFGGNDEEREKKRKREEEPRPLESNLLLKSVAVIGLVVVLTVFFILSYFVIMCDKWVIKGWQ